MLQPYQQIIIVADLGFGDAGKGTIIDFLTRKHQAHTVVRYNGGAQAAHNVVTPDGRHHTFAQFGSGSFVPGVKTYLSKYMLIEPYAMINEADHLRNVGVHDIFARTMIEERALVITPFQQAANRLKELARGGNRHGSCGMGIGETMADWLKHRDQVIFAGDLSDRPTVTRKLRFLRDAKWSEVDPLLPDLDLAQSDIRIFSDGELIDIIAENYEYLTRLVEIVDESALQAVLDQPGVVLFEGAQGVLLDECYGFAPYTTWSNTTFANALDLLAEYQGHITRLGVLRTYFARHGAGPFVTEDQNLAPVLPEAHNATSPWQQRFRLGYFDRVAARYALEVLGGVDSLAITHADRVAVLHKFASAYHFDGSVEMLDSFFEHEGDRISGIKVISPPDLAHQEQLTHLLLRCSPEYQHIDAADDYLSALEAYLGVPISITSSGATALDKQIRG